MEGVCGYVSIEAYKVSKDCMCGLKACRVCGCEGCSVCGCEGCSVYR